jgi:hypothetical protein
VVRKEHIDQAMGILDESIAAVMEMV